MDHFTELYCVSNADSRVADVALSLTLNVSGVKLPFNRMVSVIFCLNL